MELGCRQECTVFPRGVCSAKTKSMSHACFLIAMAGGSGSGKSTLAEALVETIGSDRAVKLREDNYYWPLSHYGDPATEDEWKALTRQINFDAPESKDTDAMAADMARLKSGEAIAQPVYDYDRHDRVAGAEHRVEPRAVLILEGIHVLSIPALEPLIDLSVYVETQDDLRLARRIRRDVVERGRDVEGVLQQYLATVRPAHYRHTFPAKFSADLVIADEGLPAYGRVRPSGEAIARMMAPVLERLRAAGILQVGGLAPE